MVVTGGSRGLGLAISQRLLLEGHYVITASRQLSTELAQLLDRYTGQLEHHTVDFAQAEAPMVLAKAARFLDGLDGLVANAAIGTEGLLTLTPESTLRNCVQVNLIAPMLVTREAVKGMIGAGGSLIFIASVAARSGIAGLSVYSATKGGLVSFSRSLAREYGERGIRSNCILPGFFETEMSRTLVEADRMKLKRRTALKRLGEVNDVVGAVSFLLSDESRYITGTELVVDGGMLA